MNTQLKEQDKINQLTALYKSIIDSSGATHLDFDAEGLENGVNDDLGNTPLTPEQSKEAKQIRIKALKNVKSEYPNINITFTIPTNMGDLGGIPGYSSEDMITELMDAKILNGLNLMAFDYGPNSFNVGTPVKLTAPGESALYSISSANTLYKLFTLKFGLTSQEAWDMIHITLMNGRSDVKYQINWYTDSQIMTNWAIDKNIGELSTWSTQRDLSQFARDNYSKQMGPDYGPGYLPTDKIWTEPLTIDQLMTYTDSGGKKTIDVSGVTYDINAAMTDSIGTKDFVFTNTINNFRKKIHNTPNNSLFNSNLFGAVSAGSINSFLDIENYSDVITKNIDYDPADMSVYNKFIEDERTNNQTMYFYAPNPYRSNAFNPLAFNQAQLDPKTNY